MTCHFCNYENRQLIVCYNKFGDGACERHIGDLWTVTAYRRQAELTGRNQAA